MEPAGQLVVARHTIRDAPGGGPESTAGKCRSRPLPFVGVAGGRTDEIHPALCGTRDGAWPASSPDDVRRTYADVGDWLTRNGSRIGSIHQLQPPDTATTVLLAGQRRPIIKDGPFLEGKEVVGGYCEIDVADLDEAPELAKTWPGRAKAVEIRPVVPHDLPAEPGRS